MWKVQCHVQRVIAHGRQQNICVDIRKIPGDSNATCNALMKTSQKIKTYHTSCTTPFRWTTVDNEDMSDRNTPDYGRMFKICEVLTLFVDNWQGVYDLQ